MMNGMARIALVACAMLGGAASAFAQPVAPQGGGFGRPTVSPYLNLLRTGNNNFNPAFNYLTLTRPEMQFRQQAQQLNQQLSLTNQALQQQIGMSSTIIGGDSGMPVTGHRTGFNTASSYFNTLQTGGGIGGASPRFNNIGGGAGMAGAPRGAGAGGSRAAAGMGMGRGMGATGGLRR